MIRIPVLARSRFSLVLVIALCLTSQSLCTASDAHAQGTDILPVCGVGYTINEWQAIDPLAAVYPSSLVYFDQYYIGRGLTLGCVPQMDFIMTQICSDPQNCTKMPTGYQHSIDGSATPNTIDSKNGDGQPVTLTVQSPFNVNWSQCLPGSQATPAFCTAQIKQFGAMAFRFRGTDGKFSGPWTITAGVTFPGFWIEQVSPDCDITSASCQYQVTFKRDSSGKTEVRHDAQVVLMTLIDFRIYIGIPMVIKQDPLNSVVPTPTPPSSDPSFCVVPVTKGLSLSKAKRAIVAQNCLVGKITKAKNKKIAKGKVISTKPKAKTSNAPATKVAIVVSLGK